MPADSTSHLAEDPPGGAGAPAAPERPRPCGRRAEAREQAILDAAIELLVEVGYDRLSMDALAERAHASKATIYRHWSGKAEVVAEALRCHVQPHQAVPDLGELRQELLTLLTTSCEALAGEEGALAAAVLWAMRSDPVLAALMRGGLVEEKEAQAEAVVRRAIARGEVTGGEPRVVAEVMSAMVLKRLLVTDEPLDEGFRTHLVDDVVLPLLSGATAAGDRSGRAGR